MKVGVLGDSHGFYKNIDLAMNHLKEADLLIHTGDNYKDRLYIEQKYRKKIIAVGGNCDYEGPEEILETIGGHLFFITHGHHQGVKGSINGIFYAGKEKGADIVVFGHSHVPLYAKEEGIILLNPGSVSLPRGGSRRSCAIISLDDDKIEVKFYSID